MLRSSAIDVLVLYFIDRGVCGVIGRFRTAFDVALLAAVGAVVFSGSAWSQLELPIQGGNGGGIFRVTCPVNTFMIGIEGNAGRIVDHMRLVCAPFTKTENGKNFKADQTKLFNQGEIIGESQGGAFNQAICRNGGFVKTIKFNTAFFEDKHLLEHVRITCKDAGAAESTHRFGFFESGGQPATQTCPPNMWLVGLRGRRGSFVDAIGAVCAVMP
jgi:hypothetical protein